MYIIGSKTDELISIDKIFFHYINASCLTIFYINFCQASIMSNSLEKRIDKNEFTKKTTILRTSFSKTKIFDLIDE